MLCVAFNGNMLFSEVAVALQIKGKHVWGIDNERIQVSAAWSTSLSQKPYMLMR
jgi:hypothetical protein